jgi:hypothetical protein
MAGIFDVGQLFAVLVLVRGVLLRSLNSAKIAENWADGKAPSHSGQ